ncbi:LANO_0G14598g1_1 [Lachancea nothofagi CBS 11611]|uniref:Protein RER1 n=1 Tax=Lachancea nothofagi CBS 11611 TaxID=1266666 RepID=A0A1G4KKJ1_9SACH|nr:LANO_0G14598g1_1 [Lachancea nothofagi CBS 11611]
MRMDETDKKAQTMAFVKKYQTMYQMYMDRLTPHVTFRWGALGGGLLLFFLRVAYGEGWYVVCYGLAIYLLNQFLAFLTPKFDVSLQQDEENDELEAGERVEEFKPFIRRLPEFKFWHNSIRALAECSVMTLFRIFDIPVFWPILVMYLILLFALTMRRQIQHMIKYKYTPLDIGKKRYTSRD